MTYISCDNLFHVIPKWASNSLIMLASETPSYANEWRNIKETNILQDGENKMKENLTSSFTLKVKLTSSFTLKEEFTFSFTLKEKLTSAFTRKTCFGAVCVILLQESLSLPWISNVLPVKVNSPLSALTSPGSENKYIKMMYACIGTPSEANGLRYFSTSDG